MFLHEHYKRVVMYVSELLEMENEDWLQWKKRDVKSVEARNVLIGILWGVSKYSYDELVQVTGYTNLREMRKKINKISDLYKEEVDFREMVNSFKKVQARVMSEALDIQWDKEAYDIDFELVNITSSVVVFRYGSERVVLPLNYLRDLGVFLDLLVTKDVKMRFTKRNIFVDMATNDYINSDE